MTRLLHFTLAVLFLAFWIKRCTAQIYSTQTWAGTQYIFFNGIITGTANYPSPCSPLSASYGPYPLAYLYVGVNPPWDSNPFYFELYHLASEGDGYIVFTQDFVYNLDFASAIYACYSSTGSECEFLTFNPQFRVEEKLDLTKATVSAGQVGGEAGYTVAGNSQSYVGKSTDGYSNSVDVDSGCFPLDVSWENLIWNGTISWNYTLSFSNTTATMSLLTTVKESTLNLSFSGQRSTSNNSIELDTSDPSKPQFRYNNGSNFYFYNSSGFWEVSASEFQSTTGMSTAIETGADTTSIGSATGLVTTAKATASSMSGASTVDFRPLIIMCVDPLWLVVIGILGVGLMAAFLV